MSAANTIIVAGNLTADPEFRKTSSEIPFTRMRLAVNRRTFNAETGAWEDRVDGFFSVTAWRDMARYAKQSLNKGDRVIVHGRLTHRQFEVKVGDNETESRQVTEIEAEEIGASVRWNAWSKVVDRPLNEADPLAPGERPEPPTPSSDTPEDADPVDDADVAVAAAA